ncbi:SH3 domain-containing protein [Prochlorococcus marinus]|nr:SH3 domain-containing protein [Prochlorococcus marinus]KGG13664.1 hypothetical protein EV05_0321 [Prochlorococcus sp. MIT 0601]
MRWSWVLLFFGLLGPLDLPAGGLTYKNPGILQLELSRRKYAGTNCYLRTSPNLESSVLTLLPIGTPLRIISSWQDFDRKQWLLVQSASLPLAKSSSKPYRGWVNV